MHLQLAFEIVSRPVVARVHPRPQGTSELLTAHELYAEAALLILWCEEHLTPAQMAYARCMYGGDESAVRPLAQHLAQAGGVGEHRLSGLEALVQSYCIRAIGMREIRAAMRSSMTLAVGYRNLTYSELDEMDKEVTRKLEERELHSKLLVA